VAGILRLVYLHHRQAPDPGFFKGMHPGRRAPGSGAMIILSQALVENSTSVPFWEPFRSDDDRSAVAMNSTRPYLHMGRFMSRHPGSRATLLVSLRRSPLITVSLLFCMLLYACRRWRPGASTPRMPPGETIRDGPRLLSGPLSNKLKFFQGTRISPLSDA